MPVSRNVRLSIVRVPRHYFPVVGALALLVSAISTANAEPPRTIIIDGSFDDWRDVKSYVDPPGDAHETDNRWRNDEPVKVDHPDVDLVEYRFTHDAENLYAYFRATGMIANTRKGTDRGRDRAGRYHATLAIDVDNNNDTGYWIHRGGYYPTSNGYDVNAEVEWFNGELNAGQYMNHCCRNRADLRQAFLDQSAGKYERGNDGPYPAGFMRLGLGSYTYYTQWSYHADGTITFTEDKGPVVPGIITVALSKDGHELEMGIPMKGFLVDENKKRIIELGKSLDISFSLEASGELAPDERHRWASDTGEPINGYVLEPAAKP